MKNSNNRAKSVLLLTFLVLSSSFMYAQTGITINNPASTITSSTGNIGFSNDTLTTTGRIKAANAIFSVFGTGNTGLATYTATGLFQPLNFPGDSTMVLRGNGTFAHAYGSFLQSGSNLYYTAGNVGIGTASPTHALEVSGNIQATAFYAKYTGGGITTTLTLDPSTGTFSSSNNKLNFSSDTLTTAGSVKVPRILPLDGDSLVTIGATGFQFTTHKPTPPGGCLADLITNASGIIALGNSSAFQNVFVGIGTKTPKAVLHVAGSGTACSSSVPLMFCITNTSTTKNVFTVDNGGNTFIPTGKMSIGVVTTDMPGSYKLYVKGGILTEHCRVAKDSTTDWSDYVFSNTYKLPALNEVENYINKYHHLQDIPSSDEVTKNGIDVAQMDAQLLKKVEELTLYVIQLQKDNAALKKEVESMKK